MKHTDLHTAAVIYPANFTFIPNTHMLFAVIIQMHMSTKHRKSLYENKSIHEITSVTH